METTTLNFVNGKAIVKNGRKHVAKIYDRAVYFAGSIWAADYAKRAPFSVEIKGIGQKECATLAECCEAVREYTGITVNT